MSVSRSALASCAARSACAASAASPSCAADRAAAMRAHALDALALRAELAVVDDLVQPRHARRERLLAVLVEEELGVGQARPHHALVALDHAARVGRADVADDQELFGQPARGVEQRKVLLVGLHRQDQALLRHRQELGLEAAQQHVRALDQRGHLVEQRVVVDRRAGPARGRGGVAAGAAISARRSSKLAITAPSSRSCCGVAVGVAQHDRVDRGLEAMAARRRGRPSARAPSTGTTSAPCSATRPCAGRTKLTLVQPSASW